MLKKKKKKAITQGTKKNRKSKIATSNPIVNHQNNYACLLSIRRGSTMS